MINSLKTGERIVDLDRNGLKIIQKRGSFCFGTDSVLLAAFAKTLPADRVADLCCGSGVVPILMSARYGGALYFGVEIQESVADLARRSVLLNNLQDRIHIITGDIRRPVEGLTPGTFDAVTANPPYMKADKDMPHTERNIARHELLCGVESVASAAAKLLKTGGKLYMVHRAERLADAVCALRSDGMEPKRLRFVHPYVSASPKLFLISAIKGAAAGTHVEPPLVVYKEPGVYTDEVYSIYND